MEGTAFILKFRSKFYSMIDESPLGPENCTLVSNCFERSLNDTLLDNQASAPKPAPKRKRRTKAEIQEAQAREIASNTVAHGRRRMKTAAETDVLDEGRNE